MKTVIRITENVMSDEAYIKWREDIDYIVAEIDVDCRISNHRFNNPIGSDDSPLFKHTEVVEATGYCQSDWQTYTLTHRGLESEKELLDELIALLKKTFTHKNNYFVEKFERTEIDGKVFNAEPHDFTSFAITDIEFPEEEDIINAYISEYGEDYDEVEVDI
jgi:hypothetical protein